MTFERSETQVGDPDPADGDAVLKARAAALAVPLVTDREAADALFVVQFQLAGETYGIEARHVREVQPLRDLTPLPGAPPFVLGLINVRGQILSVVDLRVLVALPNPGLADLHRVLILHHDGMEFGVAAEAVLGTLRIATAGLDPGLPTAETGGVAYVRGVTAERLIVLDAVKLLTDLGLVVDDRPGQDRGERRGVPR